VCPVVVGVPARMLGGYSSRPASPAPAANPHAAGHFADGKTAMSYIHHDRDNEQILVTITVVRGRTSRGFYFGRWVKADVRNSAVP